MESFEAIATNLADQETFNELTVIEEALALQAERVSHMPGMNICTLCFHPFILQRNMKDLVVDGVMFMPLSSGMWHCIRNPVTSNFAIQLCSTIRECFKCHNHTNATNGRG